MILLLAVLYMLWTRAADPATWRWLEEEQAQRNSTNSAAGKEPQLTPVAAETVKNGEAEDIPLDQDEEELAAAEEQFQAISDRSTELAREEMPAYWRLFRWAESQSFSQLQPRAASGVTLNQFMRAPAEERGRLVRLSLNVRRVLAYDAPLNSAGVTKVYEVWGFTDESQGWLYVGVTAHLPEGMPIGPRVNERATFVGYFLKLQGYEPGSAKPGDKPLAAPLFVGRLDWQPSLLAHAATEDISPWWWLAVPAAIAAALFGATHISGLTRRSSPTAHAPARVAITEAEVEDAPNEPVHLGIQFDQEPSGKPSTPHST